VVQGQSREKFMRPPSPPMAEYSVMSLSSQLGSEAQIGGSWCKTVQA
jgi:hypothetical protein